MVLSCCDENYRPYARLKKGIDIGARCAEVNHNIHSAQEFQDFRILVFLFQHHHRDDCGQDEDRNVGIYGLNGDSGRKGKNMAIHANADMRIYRATPMFFPKRASRFFYLQRCLPYSREIHSEESH